MHCKPTQAVVGANCSEGAASLVPVARAATAGVDGATSPRILQKQPRLAKLRPAKGASQWWYICRAGHPSRLCGHKPRRPRVSQIPASIDARAAGSTILRFQLRQPCPARGISRGRCISKEGRPSARSAQDPLQPFTPPSVMLMGPRRFTLREGERHGHLPAAAAEAAHEEGVTPMPPMARAAGPGVGEATDPRFRRQQPRPVRGASPWWYNCRVGHSPARSCGRSLRRQMVPHIRNFVGPSIAESTVLRFQPRHP